MDILKKLIKEAVQKHQLHEHKKCSCGCNSCGNKGLIKENDVEKVKIFYTDFDGFQEKQSSKIFDSEREAENFLNDNKSYSEDYDEITYFNPEDKKKYYGYEIVPASEKFMGNIYS